MTRSQRARLGYLGCGGNLACGCSSQPAITLGYARPAFTRSSARLSFHRQVPLGYLGAQLERAAARAPARATASRTPAQPALPTSAISTLPPAQQPAAAASSPAPASAAAPTSAAAIIAQICPQGITKGNCGCSVDTANVQALFTNSIQSLYLQWPPPDPSWANCSGIQGGSDLQLASKIAPIAGSLTAAGAIAAGAAAGSALPVVGTAIGAAVGLITGLFAAHHAQAVAAQNNALCISVPEFNSVLQQIDAGSVPASTATYQALLSSFTADMKAGTSYKQCDALYAYNLAAQMVIAARTANLAAGTGGGTGLTTSIAGIPLWMLLLGGGAALFLL